MKIFNSLKNNKLNNRYVFIDVFRGVCVLSMIGYHTVWDLVRLFNVKISWFDGFYSTLWQQSICWSFILLSGFCLNFGSKKFKRGFIVFICGAVITTVTYFFMPKDIIIFGILTFIGSAMLFTAFAEPIIKKIPPLCGITVNFIIFILCRTIPKYRYIGIGKFIIYKIQPELYKNYFTTFFGFMFKGFYSADYFPFLPWIFLFLTGYFLYRLLDKKGIIKKWKKSPPRKELFSLCGRYSLWIYMAHQPLIYGILFIIFKII